MKNLIEKITLKEKLGYASGDFASNLFWQTFMYFLPIFYTDVFGLPAAAAAALFGISRLLDGFTDPAMGMIADRTSSRWGKFRPYILFIAIPFGIIGVLCFTTPNLSLNGKIVYAFITYNLMMILYTAINIPYSALMGVLSPDSKERTSISSYRFILAFAAGLFITAFNNTFVEKFGGGNDALGYKYTITIYAIIAVALFIITFLTTKERVVPKKKEKNLVKNDLKDLIQNKPWLILLLAGIFTIFYVSIRNGAIAYYFKYYVSVKTIDFSLFGKELSYDLASSFMVIGTIAVIVGLTAVKWLSDVMGKKMAYFSLMLLSTVFTASFFFLDRDQVKLMFVLQILASLFMGPTSALVWAMYADIADYSEWKTGRRATGLIFSASTMAQKFGWSLAGVVTMLLLSAFGYSANMEQSLESLTGIRALISMIPAIGSIICAVLILFYALDDKFIAKIQKELAEKPSEN
jgi:GPH family glycoside/pentoside/hexuronide:cation symporter